MHSMKEEKEKKQRSRFCINDHPDILLEILTRLDERSVGVAGCVCRLWCSITRQDSVWENLCFRKLSHPPTSEVRPVVVALGGYRQLYMGCLRRVLSGTSISRRSRSGGESEEIMSRNEVQLWLSLFSIDYYERLGGVGVGKASSLMFLIPMKAKPVNAG